ncbi:hypothetical protein TWF970_007704 [Orbilia oligospora]|uniref:Uncharacterized protein n=1 Tax=Orbilia oligospora TaxID=2813651 RepID=A0A7C8R738_ORBOL|nr:hypothetical protein TWF970_007704 [Orbilia oligospora]
MTLSTRYILVDKDAPAFWDPASASAFICILTVGILGAAAVTVRLYGKLKLTGNLAWDDMFMLLAGISSVSYTVMALLQVRYGLVVPMQERPYEVQLRYQTINYTARVFYLTGLIMSNGRLETKCLVMATFASCSAVGITSIIALALAFPQGAVEGVTLQIGILLQLMYGFIAITSTCFDIICFALPFLFLDNRYLNTVQRNHRRGWMYVTFATTFSSIMRAFTIAPATSIFSTESEALVIMGTLELNMGIISTSLPSWYMWMDISRKGKRKFRDYQPIRSLRRLFLPLANPLQRWVRRSYYNFITKNEDKMGMSKILRQLQQIQDLPYYQMLFWNAEVNPIERAMGIRAKFWNITSRFQRWLRITEADLSYRFRTFIRLNKSPSLSDGIELDSTEENDKREKSKTKGRSDLDIPTNEQFNEGQDMEPLLKEQRESFLTNRNYNILFTSDKTLTDMIRDEELEYIEGIQWQAINEEQVDFKMRQNLAPTQNRNLDGLLFDEGSTSGWANGKTGKQRGIRRRK